MHRRAPAIELANELESIHPGHPRERPADLLITDIFMPVQEGFETISRFKAEFPQTRVIVMSAGNVPGMKHDFLATAALLGVGATLRKPFDADQLLDAVRRVLQPGT